MTTVETFQDETDAIQRETVFSFSLDSGNAPFSAANYPHIGEGGATSAYYQGVRLVGLVARVRDDFNRTVLVCTDLRK